MGEGEREGGRREGGGAGPGRARLPAPPRGAATHTGMGSVPAGRQTWRTGPGPIPRGAMGPGSEGRGGEEAPAQPRDDRPSLDPLWSGGSARSAFHLRSSPRQASPNPDRFLAPLVVLVERSGILPHATSALITCDFGWNTRSKLRND